MNEGWNFSLIRDGLAKEQTQIKDIVERINTVLDKCNNQQKMGEEHLKSKTNSSQLKRERETASLQRALNLGCKGDIAKSCT